MRTTGFYLKIYIKDRLKTKLIYPIKIRFLAQSLGHGYQYLARLVTDILNVNNVASN